MLTNPEELVRDAEGATAVESGMIVAAIASIVFTLGVKVNTAFTAASDQWK